MIRFTIPLEPVGQMRARHASMGFWQELFEAWTE